MPPKLAVGALLYSQNSPATVTESQIWQCPMDQRPDSYSKNIIPPKIAEQNVYYIKHKSIKGEGHRFLKLT